VVVAISVGRLFQAVGPATPNARSPNFSDVFGTSLEWMNLGTYWHSYCSKPCHVQETTENALLMWHFLLSVSSPRTSVHCIHIEILMHLCSYRHEMLIARFFKRQVLASNALFHYLLPIPSVRAHTNEFHKSFLSYCLRNFT